MGERHGLFPADDFPRRLIDYLRSLYYYCHYHHCRRYCYYYY